MRYSPNGPPIEAVDPDDGDRLPAAEPDGTFVMFIDVKTPVLGSYVRQTVPRPVTVTGAMSKPSGKTPCWLPDSKEYK